MFNPSREKDAIEYLENLIKEDKSDEARLWFNYLRDNLVESDELKRKEAFDCLSKKCKELKCHDLAGYLDQLSICAMRPVSHDELKKNISENINITTLDGLSNDVSRKLNPKFIKLLSSNHEIYNKFELNIIRDECVSTIEGKYFSVQKLFLLAAIKNSEMSFVSPFSGDLVTDGEWILSNVYRFDDNGEDFFLTFTQKWAPDIDVWQVYIPKYSLIICVHDDQAKSESVLKVIKPDIIHKTSHLLVAINSYARKRSEKVQDRNRGSILAIEFFPHVGHNLWNNLSVLGVLNKISAFNDICAVNIPACLYPGVEQYVKRKGVDYISIENDRKLYDFAVESGVSVITLKDNYITSDLAAAIISGSKDAISESDRSELLNFRSKHYPIVLITQRQGNRSWDEQEKGLEQVMLSIIERNQRAGFVIDGVNSDDVSGLGTHKHIDSSDEYSLAERLKDRVGETRVWNCIGSSIALNILLCEISDIFVAPWGAGLAKSKWISNKPGVVYSNQYVINSKYDLRIYDTPAFRENSFSCSYLSGSSTYEGEVVVKKGITFDQYRCNFSLNWKMLLEALDKELLVINMRRNENMSNSIKSLL